MANTGYDWQTLVNKIGDTTSQVVSLEIEYGTSSMIYQNRRHSLDLSLTVFIIALLSSVALFFRSTWTATIAFLVAMCFLASAIFDFYRAMRESKKMEESLFHLFQKIHQYSSLERVLEVRRKKQNHFELKLYH